MATRYEPLCLHFPGVFVPASKVRGHLLIVVYMIGAIQD